MSNARAQTSRGEFPRTFQEFGSRFPTEAACHDFIRGLRWPDGFTCPQCGVSEDPWEMSRGRLRCRSCEGEITVTAGTIFQDTHKPLRTWFLAMWFITNQKDGMNAKALQRVLGIGSYRTAWTWMHKLRQAMVPPGQGFLRGEIDVDTICFGNEEGCIRGAVTRATSTIALAVEKTKRGMGRVRLRCLSDASDYSLAAFVQSIAEPSATIHINGWSGNADLFVAGGCSHEVTGINATAKPPHGVKMHAHKVAELLRLWLMETLHGGIQHQHLDYYLDEFTFRFSSRNMKAKGLLFYRLVSQAVAMAPTPYLEIVHQDESGDVDRGPLPCPAESE